MKCCEVGSSIMNVIVVSRLMMLIDSIVVCYEKCFLSVFILICLIMLLNVVLLI